MKRTEILALYSDTDLLIQFLKYTEKYPYKVGRYDNSWSIETKIFRICRDCHYIKKLGETDDINIQTIYKSIHRVAKDIIKWKEVSYNSKLLDDAL